MHRIAVGLALMVIAHDAAAQDGASRPATGRRSHFGAPVVKYTALRGQGAVMFGGRGGLNLTPSLMLGAGAYGTMTGVDAATDAVPSAPYALDVKLESFGFDVEYAVRPAARTHLTLGAFLGGAAARYVRDGTNEQHGETDFMLLLEPSVGVQQRVTDGLHLHLAVSYRLVRGVEQAGLETSDLAGPAAALALKIGRF